MPEPIDYSAFDRPDITSMVFYPRRDASPPPAGAIDCSVTIEDGVQLWGRLYPHETGSPNVLLFHGNGEVVADYDGIARLYHQAGVGFLVMDFRGYGQSGGMPSISTMLSDGRAYYEHVRGWLPGVGYHGPMFVKGRSLGALCAVEVAAHYQDELRGLIIESGAAGLKGMASRWGMNPDEPPMSDLLRLHREKVRSITLPLLMIHGERDDLIPIESAMELYDGIGSTDKDLELIPGAGHNDLLWVGEEQYFGAVRRFVESHGGSGHAPSSG